MMRYFLMMSTVALFTFGCEETLESNSTTYSYEYEVNGCKTGKHEFDSLEKYCRGLINDELNKHCATSMRDQSFDKECGEFKSLKDRD